MSRYLISFPEGAMTFPDEDLPDVAAASHAVVREAKAAGVWVFGGGLLDHNEATTVASAGRSATVRTRDDVLRRRVLDTRCRLKRRGGGLGREDRRRLSLLAGGARAH